MTLGTGYAVVITDKYAYSSTTLGIMGTAGSTVVEQQTLDRELKGSNRGAVCSGMNSWRRFEISNYIEQKLKTISKHLACLNFN